MKPSPFDRIELIRMSDDPAPIEPGARGTVRLAHDCPEFLQIDVDWDNGRSLMLTVPPDQFRLLEPWEGPKHKRFIAVSRNQCWGCGETEALALQNLRNAGGRFRKNSPDTWAIWRFESMLQFAPFDRSANEYEADCWIGSSGEFYALRCTKYAHSGAATKGSCLKWKGED